MRPFARLAVSAVALGFFLSASAQTTIDHEHLSLTGGSEPVVVWRSPAPVDAVVEYGPTDAYGTSVRAASEPEAAAGGVMFWAVLPDVPPGEEVHYRVSQADFATEDAVFRAPPASNASVTFTAWGDHGVSSEAARNVANAAGIAPAFHLHAGDLSYANGVPAIWDTWFQEIRPLASRSFYMPSPGNHEYEPHANAVEGVRGNPAAYLARFVLPNNEFWYAFTYGPVRVIALDTESLLGDGSDQRDWLVNELASEASRTASWRVVLFHRAAYSSNANHGSFGPARGLDPLFDAGRVDLVIAGHDHHYERTYPLRGGEPVTSGAGPFPAGSGTVHVVTGGGGEGLYEMFQDPQPEWSAVRMAVFELLRVDATVEELRARAIDLDGKVVDAFTIQKATPEPPAPPLPPPAEPERTPGPGVAGLVLALLVVTAIRRAKLS